MRTILQVTAAAILTIVSIFLVACALCFLTGKARGQGVKPDCPDGMCLKSGPLVSGKDSKKATVPAALTPGAYSNDDGKYEWVQRSSDQFILSRNGVTIGQWYVPNHTYYPWNGKEILPAVKPPIDPPGTMRQTIEQKHLLDTGVSRAEHDREQLTFSGKAISPGRLSEAFNGQLQDDSDKGYLVIICKDAAKSEAVFQDWKKLPDDFTSRFLVWRAPPDHFSMQDRFANKPRFFTEGDPTVVLQSHDGTVLFRRPQAGQVYKASDMQDVLKSDDSYKPALDPGGHTPVSSFSLSPQAATSLMLAGIGGVVFLYRRKK